MLYIVRLRVTGRECLQFWCDSCPFIIAVLSSVSLRSCRPVYEVHEIAPSYCEQYELRASRITTPPSGLYLDITNAPRVYLSSKLECATPLFSTPYATIPHVSPCIPR